MSVFCPPHGRKKSFYGFGIQAGAVFGEINKEIGVTNIRNYPAVSKVESIAVSTAKKKKNERSGEIKKDIDLVWYLKLKSIAVQDSGKSKN